GHATTSRTTSRPTPPGSSMYFTLGLPFTSGRTTRLAPGRKRYDLLRVETATRTGGVPAGHTWEQIWHRNTIRAVEQPAGWLTSGGLKRRKRIERCCIENGRRTVPRRRAREAGPDERSHSPSRESRRRLARGRERSRGIAGCPGILPAGEVTSTQSR